MCFHLKLLGGSFQRLGLLSVHIHLYLCSPYLQLQHQYTDHSKTKCKSGVTYQVTQRLSHKKQI